LAKYPIQKGNPNQNFGKGLPPHPQTRNMPPDYTIQPKDPAFITGSKRVKDNYRKYRN
jgi:hypothetical protein